MANQQVHEPLAPIQEGEFHRIQGIGPGIEQRLHAAGITTFNHLASLTAEEIHAMLNGMVGMTTERIVRQDWPGQALRLAKELSEAQPPAAPDAPAERQHYASFMVELLQEEDHSIRLTRVVHVQNGEKEAWAGWDTARLTSWIAAQAGFAMPVPEALKPQPRKAGEKTQPFLAPPEISPVTLSWGELTLPNHAPARRFLDEDQPFEIHLTLDFENGGRPRGKLVYQAEMAVRPVGSGERRPVTGAAGICAETGPTALVFCVPGLQTGTYHLEVNAVVYPEGALTPEKSRIVSFLEGGLLHVYARETESV